MPIELVIFDHDGVMVDSSGHIYDAIWNLCHLHPSFKTRAVPRFPDFLEFFRLPGDEWFKSYGFDFPAAVIEKILRQAPDKAEMFSTVPPMLQRLKKESKLPIIMISAGDQSRIEGQLGQGKILHYFESVIGGVIDKTMAIACFCSVYDISPARTVYVGDVPSDMENGRAAGTVTVGFTDDRPIMERILIKAGAKHCVRNHQELGNLLLHLAEV